MATCDINNEMSESVAEKQRIKNHQSRFYIRFEVSDRTASFNDQCYSILFDPRGDKNCQFTAVAFALRRFGIIRTAMEIRPEVVEDLSRNTTSPDGMNLELFAGVP